MISQIKTNWLIPGAIIAAGLIIAGAIVYTKNNPDRQKAQILNQKENSVVIKETDHILGNPQASVTIIEYSDFECSFCKGFHPTIRKIIDNYPNDVRWIYRHFPLDKIHSQATPAAEASECAAEQGKFWQFADGLFENQPELGKEAYQKLVQQLELNTEKFNSCLSSKKYQNKVKEDLQEGIKAGVKGAPAAFINNRLVSGTIPYNQLETIIKQALADSK